MPAPEPSSWVDDTRWHRRMFGQSLFRWSPEDPLTLTLAWTRGRVLYETPRHLRLLSQQIIELRGFAASIDDTIVALLEDARRAVSPPDWETGLRLVDLTSRDVAVLRQGSIGRTDIPLGREAAQILASIPLPNPFTKVWELRQLRALYDAADRLLEDTFCDLSLELAPTQGWGSIAALTGHYTPNALQMRVADQRANRGDPGDPRRRYEQHYPALI